MASSLYCSLLVIALQTISAAKVVTFLLRAIRKQAKYDTKNEAKKIKSDNFTRRIREKSNYAIWTTNIILANSTYDI